MDESKRRVIQFLEKEIKTKERVRPGDRGKLLSPAFYKERMKEAKRLVL